MTIVTAYCACALCCGTGPKPTASGLWPQEGRTAAATRNVPLGTRVEFTLPDGRRFIRVVEDRMSRKYDNGMRFDIYFRKHKEAKKFGRQLAAVRLLPPR